MFRPGALFTRLMGGRPPNAVRHRRWCRARWQRCSLAAGMRRPSPCARWSGLRLGEPGVVVGGGVDEAVADHGTAAFTRVGSGLSVGWGLPARHDPMAAAVGDVAGLLDVDMDEFAGARSFVATCDLAGGPVQPAQAVQAVAGQNAVHRGGGYSQDRADPCGADLPLRRRAQIMTSISAGGAVRGGSWPARTVVQPCVALDAPRRTHL